MRQGDSRVWTPIPHESPKPHPSSTLVLPHLPQVGLRSQPDFASLPPSLSTQTGNHHGDHVFTPTRGPDASGPSCSCYSPGGFTLPHLSVAPRCACWVALVATLTFLPWGNVRRAAERGQEARAALWAAGAGAAAGPVPRAWRPCSCQQGFRRGARRSPPALGPAPPAKAQALR